MRVTWQDAGLAGECENRDRPGAIGMQEHRREGGGGEGIREADGRVEGEKDPATGGNARRGNGVGFVLCVVAHAKLLGGPDAEGQDLK